MNDGADVISARPARSDDGPALDRLREAARTETREKRGGARFVDELDAARDEAGPSDVAAPTALVGTIDGAVVSYATVARTGRVALV